MEIKRLNYLNRLIDKQDNGMIKIITGLRRSGKSYLLYNLFRKYLLENVTDENHIIYLALDAEENKKYWDASALNDYLLLLFIVKVSIHFTMKLQGTKNK